MSNKKGVTTASHIEIERIRRLITSPCIVPSRSEGKNATKWQTNSGKNGY